MNITLFIKEKLTLLSMIHSLPDRQGATRKGQFEIIVAKPQERTGLSQLVYFVDLICHFRYEIISNIVMHSLPVALL